MTDHSKKLSYENAGYISGKMVNDLSPKKTLLVLVIVVGCFAVLWPKVFYPMLVGSVNNRIKPSPIDRTQGCCDVLLEKDVTTIKLMSEICNTIIRQDSDNPLSNKELISKCQNAVLDTCGIDISAVLQEQVRLGHTTKHILEEIRSLNGSLCLKYNFGVAPWKLGVPHRITVKVSPSYTIRQERPLHLRSEMVHPAFRERGRAIPQAESFSPTKPSPPSRLISKVVEGRPGPIPGMRPTIGGAGHVVPPSKHGGNSMGLIMPIYTIGIVVFFTYTVMKIIFKKQPEVLYPPVEPDPHFKREVFEADRGHAGSRVSKDGVSSKIVVNAMSALLDEVDLELSSRRKPSEVDQQDVVANGSVPNQEDDQGSVQVLGMETTASYEGGQKWIRPDSPLLPVSHSPPPVEPETPPQEIFLEGSLPPQSHLLVTDSATEAQKTEHEEDPAVVLAGKMTLSVISLDSTENGTDESSSSSKKHEERSSSNISEEFEKIDVSQLEKQIEDILEVQAGSSERDISNETSQESINIDFCEPKNKISEEDLASLQLDSLNSFREEPINSGNTDSMDKLLVQPKSFENIDDIVQDLLNRDFTEPNEVSMVQPISLKQENQNETKQELLDTEYREPNETVSILQSTSIERDNLENIEQELLSTSYTEENNDIKQESLTTEDLGMNRKDSEIQLEPAVTELDENINAESLVVEKEECPSKELEENILSSEKVRENLDDIEQELLSTAYTEENNDIRQESLTTEDLGMHRKDSEIQLEPAVTELDKNINAESLVVEKEECPSKELEENILSSEKVLPIKLAAKSSNDKNDSNRNSVEIVPEEIEYVSDAEEDSGEEEEVEEEEELVEEEEEIEVEEEEEDENEDIEEM